MAEHFPHPVPAKRAEGKTKTRLRPDPRCAHVVPLIFGWRVEDRLGYKRIRERLNGDLISYPPPINPNPNQRSGLWTLTAIHKILSNPKYTGYGVWNQCDAKGRPKEPSEWVWSAEPAHEALVSRQP